MDYNFVSDQLLREEWNRFRRIWPIFSTRIRVTQEADARCHTVDILLKLVLKFEILNIKKDKNDSKS